MPPDNSLNFTTSVDVTSLESGLDEAKVSFSELSLAAQQSEDAVDAVMDAFKEFDTILASHIAANQAYEDSIQAVAASYEQQIAAQQQAAASLAAENIAQIILAETSVSRSAKEIAAANVRRGIDEEQATRTAFAVELNETYADSVSAVAASYAALTAQQAANAAAQAQLEETAAFEAELGATVEEANAQLEAQGLLWLQNQQAMGAATEATVAATAANADLGASTMTLAEQDAAQVTAVSAQAAALAAYEAVSKRGVAAQAALGAAYDAATASGLGFTEALNAAVAAVAKDTAGNAANTVSLRANAAAAEADAVAEYSRAEAFGTARISAGLLAGSFVGVEYGLARIAAASEVVGPLLMAAMPYAIFAAIGYAAVEMGESIYKAFDMGGQGAQKLAENLDSLDLKFQKENDDLDLQIQKIAKEIAQVEKVPFNGLQLALAETAVAADNLEDKLEAAYKESLKLLQTQEQEGGLKPNKLWGFVPTELSAGTGPEEEMLKKHVAAMQNATTEQDKLNTSTAYFFSLQERYSALASTKDIYKTDYYDREIAAVQELVRRQNEEEQTIRKVMLAEAEEIELAKKREEKPGKDPNIEKLKQIRDQFEDYKAQMVSTHGELTAGEGASFWAQYLTTFEDGSDQARQVLAQYVQFQAQMHTKLQEGVKKVTDEQRKTEDTSALDRGEAAIRAWADKTTNDLLRTGESWAGYWREVKNGEEIATTNSFEQQKASLAVAEASGRITKLGEDQQLASIHAAEYAAKLRELNEELAKLKILATGLKPGDEGYEKNIQQQQNVANQILKTQGTATVAAITDNGKVTQDILAPFERAFKGIETDFFKAQQSILNGTQSVSRAFGKMGVDIVQQTEIAFEKMLLNYIGNEAKILLIHTLTNAGIITSDQAAAAAGSAIKKASTIEDVFIDAKKAAAATFSWATGYVGPVIAAALAAGAFTATLALGAFDTGGIIPGSGAVPILGHGGERVLTQGQTQTFDRMVNNMTSTQTNSPKVTLHYAPTIHGGDSHALQADHILNVVRQGIRKGSLSR
jgi:hypothetical protein